MGLLDLMFGRSMGDEDAYTLSKAEYEAAFAVAVRRTELEAATDLVRAEAETPYLEDGEDLGSVLEETLEGEFDADAWRDRMREPRQAVEPVVERWCDQLEDDVAVVYTRPSTPADLLAFLDHCKQRGEQEYDPFELPDRAADVMALVTRLEDALEREESRVFVAARHVPEAD